MKPSEFLAAHHDEVHKACLDAALQRTPSVREEAADWPVFLKNRPEAALAVTTATLSCLMTMAMDHEHERAVAEEKALGDKLDAIRDHLLHHKPLT